MDKIATPIDRLTKKPKSIAILKGAKKAFKSAANLTKKCKTAVSKFTPLVISISKIFKLMLQF